MVLKSTGFRSSQVKRLMEPVTLFSQGYEYSTRSWGDDVDSGSGQSFWFSGSGSILSADDTTASIDDSSVAMIDPDGILLFGLAPSTTNSSMDDSLPAFLFNSTLTGVTDVPAYIRIATTCIMSVILLVGITGNVLVPIVIAHSKDLRNSTNVFLVNLALADLLVILICLPTGFVELHSTPGVWYLGETMCKSNLPFIPSLIFSRSQGWNK